jgi:hypothetical protein
METEQLEGEEGGLVEEVEREGAMGVLRVDEGGR